MSILKKKESEKGRDMELNFESRTLPVELFLNGVRYVRTEERASKEPVKSRVMVNGRDVPATIVGGEAYLTFHQAARVCENVPSGFTKKISDLEKKSGLKIRHKFNLNKRNTYIKVSDLEKHILSE